MEFANCIATMVNMYCTMNIIHSIPYRIKSCHVISCHAMSGKQTNKQTNKQWLPLQVGLRAKRGQMRCSYVRRSIDMYVGDVELR